MEVIYLAVLVILIQFGYILYKDIANTRERNLLIDRIMSKDYRDYVSGQVQIKQKNTKDKEVVEEVYEEV